MNLPSVLLSAMKRAVSEAQRAAEPLERAIARRRSEAGVRNYPPVFIVGPPRSGTTLLYSLLASRYQFTYFTNWSSWLYRVPALAARVGVGLRSRRSSFDFDGISYGHVPGAHGPHECGEFWYRWFPRGAQVYVGPNTTAPAILQELRQEIGAMSALTSCPVLIKNIYNSMRVSPILEALPEATFLVCTRNYEDVAVSVLQGRKTKGGSRDAWWSLPPRGSQQHGSRDFAGQIADQVSLTYRQLEDDRKMFGPERFMDVDYEALCTSTWSELERIRMFLANRGVRLVDRQRVPQSFAARRHDERDPDAAAVRRAVRQVHET